MKLYIDAGQTIKDLNAIFQKEYPFLKLCFFRKTRKKASQLLHEGLLNDDTKFPADLEIRFTRRTSIEDLEKRFRDAGMNMQVFRKAGHSWLLTTTSDAKSIDELNRLGEEMSIEVPEEKETDVDVY